MNTRILRPLALLAVLIVVGSAGYLMTQPGNDATIGEERPVPQTQQTYDNSRYGIHFSYPDTYVLTERDEPGSAERAHHSIVIMDKTAAANIPEGGEGPPTITIDIFGNALDKQSTEAWIKNAAISNFKLSPDQKLSSTTVAGLDGLSYTWDGLYRGESMVVAHGTDIVMFSVTSLDPADVIREDFAVLLRSVHVD